MDATTAFQVWLSHHTLTRAREMGSQKWWGSVHVSATTAFQAQVSYRTLASVREMNEVKVMRECECGCYHRISGLTPSPHTDECEGDGQSKVVGECACECNHRISGSALLPHTDECGKDEPVKSVERVCM